MAESAEDAVTSEEWLDEGDLEEEEAAFVDIPLDETEQTPTLMLGNRMMHDMARKPRVVEPEPAQDAGAATVIEPLAGYASIAPVAWPIRSEMPPPPMPRPAAPRSLLVALIAAGLTGLMLLSGVFMLRAMQKGDPMGSLLAAALAPAPIRTVEATAPAATPQPTGAVSVNDLPIAPAPKSVAAPKPAGAAAPAAAPQVADAAAKPQAAATTGILQISSSKPAKLTVDGRPVGATPASVRVPVGSHTVMVTGELGRNLRVVRVEPGTTQRIRF